MEAVGQFVEPVGRRVVEVEPGAALGVDHAAGDHERGVREGVAVLAGGVEFADDAEDTVALPGRQVERVTFSPVLRPARRVPHRLDPQPPLPGPDSWATRTDGRVTGQVSE